MLSSLRCFKLLLVINLFFLNNAVAEDNTAASNKEDVVSQTNSENQPAGNIPSLEWHGQATTDIYDVDTRSDTNNGALSGLREGTFSLTTLQGDLRAIEQAGDVNYLQGGISLTRDRAKQTLYSSQIINLQLGRAGGGYQLAAGDVMVDFSKIGSTTGVRGLYAAKQVNASTLYGFAGIVSDSWEALFNRNTLNNQPARSKFLRDVAGVKLDHKLNEQWNVFGTAQTYHDRQSSLDNLQAALQTAQTGYIGTAGLRYQTNQAAFSAEFGRSQRRFDDIAKQSDSDSAVLLDVAYGWQTFSINAGYHNIGARYTSLGNNVAPGIRESFISNNWTISPSFTYVNDIRRTDSRNVNLLDNQVLLSRTDSITNRLSYNITAVPGLNMSLQDSRNWSEVQTNTSRNTSTQLGTFYSNQHYSGSITLGNAKQRTNNNPDSNSVTDSVQMSLGRQVLEGELIVLPNLSGGIQLNGGYQQQRIANGTQTSSGNQGVSLNAYSQKLGQLQLGLTNVDTRQPNGRASLNTKAVNLDWSKVVSAALAFKAYIHNNYRNHGDSLQAVDEKIVGIQGDYQW